MCNIKKSTDKSSTILTKNGIDRLLKRASKKYLGSALAVGLANVGDDLKIAYWRSWRCASVYQRNGEGRFITWYCGARWCLLCSAIRTAKAIRRYLPVIETWKDPQFVTLTKITVPGDELEKALDDMSQAMKMIFRRLKRHGYVIKLIKKIECTKSSYLDRFHPHYHLIVEGKEEAECLRLFWFEYWNRKGVPIDWKAQDIRPADKGALKELFKYFTKILTSKKDSDRAGGRRVAELVDLDIIFSAMKRRQVWRAVGFTPVGVDEDESIQAGLRSDNVINKIMAGAGDTETVVWSQVATDWISLETGECVSGFEPAKELRKVVEAIASAELVEGDVGGAVAHIQQVFSYKRKYELRKFFDLADNPPNRETFEYIYSMSYTGLLRACEDVIKDNQAREACLE